MTEERLERVERLIRQIHRVSQGVGPKVCEECFRVWPCPTFKALPGASSEETPKPEPVGYAAWWGQMVATHGGGA